MKLKNYFLILFLCFFFFDNSRCQEIPSLLSLHEVITIAKEQSPDAILAKHRYRSSYWSFKTHIATFRPTLFLDATLPSMNRSISKLTLPDGSEAFVEQSLANYSMDLSLNKTIGLTGGQIFMKTGLERIDIFSDSTVTSWLSNPVTIGYSQPLLNYNEFKWLKKIEPLKYNEAERRYLEDVEDISIKATNLFFDLLLAQINVEIAKINQANNDTLYKIAKGRYNYGKIAENELLQMELSLLNSNSQLEESVIDVQFKLYRLKSFLGIKDNKPIQLFPPAETYKMQVDLNKALEEAKQNRADALAFERRIIEAESDVNRAKAENRFNANLYALYGLTQSSSELKNVYRSPQDQQQFALGVEVPILDWGMGKGRIKMAESQQELVITNVEQERNDFEQEIFLKVMEFNRQENKLLIAAKADTIGQKRYMVTKQRYLIGKIDITELNIALAEKDAARRDYISALRMYWTTFFGIRKLTLYDFLLNKTILFNVKILQ